MNGVYFVQNDDVSVTFVGPNAGRMLWVYVIITLFTAAIVITIAAFVSSYWNKIVAQASQSRDVHSGDQPHVVNKQPRYLDPFLRGEAPERNDENNRRNISGSIV